MHKIIAAIVAAAALACPVHAPDAPSDNGASTQRIDWD